MRVSDIIGLAIDYLWLGIIGVGILGFGYWAWYCLYFKKKNPDKKVNKKKLIGWGIFVIYLVVVFGATMLSRGGFYGNTKIYPLFYSYKDAWTDYSITEWRNIILNIIMFVPFGFFWPQLIKKMASFWKMSIIGFIFTFCIEVLQLLLKRGVFEPDDLLGNTVGTMIGYGVYYLATYLMKIRKKKEVPNVWRVLLHQVPLLLTIGVFSTIFLIYHTKSFGNMPSACILKQKNIEVSSEIEFSDAAEEVMVYETVVLTSNETKQMAESIFEKLGYKLDESRTDIYENTALYYSQGDENMGNRYSLWMEYDGGGFRLTDFEKTFQNENDTSPKEDATETEVKEALDKMGVNVPIGAVLKKGEEGEYTFCVDKQQLGDKLYDGCIKCTYYEDGTLGMVHYTVLALDEYKTAEVVSEAEAYEQIQKGYFSYFRPNDEILSVEITGVEVGYEMDTKGFYQPVYLFEGNVNGTETKLVVPAIK